MFRKIGRLFVIKTRFEAYVIIFALAMGAMQRGSLYLIEYPGWAGWTLFAACSGAVFLGGAKILDCLKLEREKEELLAAQVDQRELDHAATLGFGKKVCSVDREQSRTI